MTENSSHCYQHKNSLMRSDWRYDSLKFSNIQSWLTKASNSVLLFVDQQVSALRFHSENNVFRAWRGTNELHLPGTIGMVISTSAHDVKCLLDVRFVWVKMHTHIRTHVRACSHTHTSTQVWVQMLRRNPTWHQISRLVCRCIIWNVICIFSWFRCILIWSYCVWRLYRSANNLGVILILLKILCWNATKRTF